MENAVTIRIHQGEGRYHCDYNRFVFPGGEVQVKLSDFHHPVTGLSLEARLRQASDIMELFLVTDALRRKYPGVEIYLILRYLPYARQDRVCVQGEALAIKVFCDLINAQKYAAVEIWDCHSDVGLAVLDTPIHVQQQELVRRVLRHHKDPTRYTLVAPDAGAAKKIKDVVAVLAMPFIQAQKTRNPNDGKITGVKIDDEVSPDQHYLIVDDICDGGATFIGLADKLKQAGATKVSLYVTHGIFSRGLTPLSPLFERIYCANSWLEPQGNLFTL